MLATSKSIVIEVNKSNKLNGDNYVIRAMKSQHVPKKQEAHDLLELIMVEPEDSNATQHRCDHEAYVAWKKKNTITRIIILSAMDDDIAKQFKCYKFAKDIWTVLKETFNGMSMTRF